MAFMLFPNQRPSRLQTKSGPIQIVGIPWPTRNTIALGDAHLFKSTSQITEYISKAVNAIIQDLAAKIKS